MQAALTVVVLFSVAAAVALLARRWQLPYTVALVLAGLALGATGALDPPHLTRDLLYAVFLPGLLFEAAFAIDFPRFKASWPTIALLAGPGLLLGIGLTAALLVPLAGALGLSPALAWAPGLLFAAVTAATDPIAVVALFKRLKVPGRLAMLVEGESLLNDGTAVVVFSIALAAVGGQQVSAASATLDLVRMVGLGAAVGAAVGLLASLVIQRVDDPMIEMTLTTVSAYGAFLAAEALHDSGVIATVTAGLLCGTYAARTGMSPTTRVAVASFWEYLAFALNSLVFLLIGLEVRLAALLEHWALIVLAYLAMTLARGLMLGAAWLALRPTRQAFPRAWAAVLTWGGLRGSLSMVLVLALPADLPLRDTLVAMVFGVVVLSILVQGLSMAPLLRRLGLGRKQEAELEYERLQGSRRATLAALDELHRLLGAGALTSELAQELQAGLTARAAALGERLKALRLSEEALRLGERHTALRQLLLAEKDALVTARRLGQLGQDSYEALVAEVDARLLELGPGR